MAKKDNTILYVAAGAAALYFLTQQRQQPTYLPTPTRTTTGWDVAGQAVSILGDILPGILGGKKDETPGVGNVYSNAVNSYKVNAEAEEFAKWN